MSALTFTPAFAPGGKGWVYYGERVRQLTIGMVRVQLTQAVGVPAGLDRIGTITQYSGGSGEPDNYSPQQSYCEQYMCEETGIGSGSVWELDKSIFRSEKECATAAAEMIAERDRKAAEAEAHRKKSRDDRERSLRAELALIESLRAREQS